ncbi:MAG: His-Xaa-Ser system protein HxsD [Pseudomonadota bacterium]|nr:His-Xaa-Ser system protein HxsD [Pseudomonadota bacterium]
MTIEPNGLTTEVGARRVSFVVDESIYALDTIQGAAYLFLDRCYVFLDRPADQRVAVVLKSKDEADHEALEALAGEFANELLNQALRKAVGASNAKIREFILAKAFFSVDAPSSIDKLLAELDAEEMEPLEIPVPWEKSDG